MRSFEKDRLNLLSVPQELIVRIGKIRELKGRQELHQRQQPEVLKALRQSALIQSVESSNRIEQITASPARITQIVRKNATPQNRSEAEIAGYKHVLKSVHDNALNIPRSTSVILQFHRDLYRYVEGRGGYWKRADNSITETGPDGKQKVRFETVPAFKTPSSMEQLQTEFNRAWDNGLIDRLVLIPAFILDFLSIHPFADGNGRMARLLALLHLYQDGLEVGRYISLERQIEDTKEQYYETLYASSQGWHEGRHDPMPFIDYFLSVVLLPAYRQFEESVQKLTLKRGAKKEAVRAAVAEAAKEFKVADIERMCPSVSRATINLVLRQMRNEGAIRCFSSGPHAQWRKANAN